MTQVASIDFATKRIFLHLDTVTNGFDPVLAHFDIKALVSANATYQGYKMPTSAEGNVSKGGGKYTPKFVFMQTSWRWVPYALVSHTLYLKAESISSTEGLTDSFLFDRSTLSPSIYVDIVPDYEKIEIREVNGLSDADGDTIATKVWTYTRA